MSSKSSCKGAAGAAAGRKAARACDGCLRRRARWYCGSDDAFLCQRCDTSVHSANPLARRHERVRLRPSPAAMKGELAPAWFKRKARSPRGNKRRNLMTGTGVVPEMVENSDENDEADVLLYHAVPEFDEIAGVASSGPLHGLRVVGVDFEGSKASAFSSSSNSSVSVATPADADELAVFALPEGEEMDRFASDMEALLGDGIYDDKFDILFSVESLEIAGSLPANVPGCGAAKPDAIRYGTEEQKLILKLDYGSIIESWGTAPWTGGEPPDVNAVLFWPEHHFPGNMWVANGVPATSAAALPAAGETELGREAKVRRYREKRRRRLFDKKIRYEVRRLNAEKRPRMKGRFVKEAPPPPEACRCR